MSSSIEWTDETWNPAVGCERVSPGCDNCYAVRVAAREMQPAHVGLTVRGGSADGRAGEPGTARAGHAVDHAGETNPLRPPRALDWTGEVRLLPERLEEPLRWRRPRRVFVGSMTDLFHPDVPDEFIWRVVAVMDQADQHTFQVLTKRPQRMEAFFRSRGEPPENVWLGTSVENQRYADLRIPHLLATPAAVRFLSIEPLLGPVDLRVWLDPIPVVGEAAPVPWIDWVIVGGESGPGARPMHPAWVRDLRDQCTAAGVPYFFKQWGEWVPRHVDRHRYWRGRSVCIEEDGTLLPYELTPADDPAVTMHATGKRNAGRELDGRTWDEMPERAA